MPANYYGILGVDADATVDDIRDAYRRRAMEVHPDRPGGDALGFQRVQEAYRMLADPARRRSYDRQRRGTGGRVPEPLRPARAAGQPPAEPLVPPAEPFQDPFRVPHERGVPRSVDALFREIFGTAQSFAPPWIRVRR